MRKFLSIFMSLVMVVTILPSMSCTKGETEAFAWCIFGCAEDEKNHNKEDFFTGLEERHPSLAPYIKKVAIWCKDYKDGVVAFTNNVGALGVAATIGLSALVVKLGWKVLKFIVWLFSDEDNKQAGYYNSNSAYSTGRGANHFLHLLDQWIPNAI